MLETTWQIQNMKAKEEYDLLLPELGVLYPELSGSWEQDKEAFTEIWEENKKLFKHLDIK